MFLQNRLINYSMFITVASLFFWNTPLIYPIKYFVIMIHEINHALLAFVTGGNVEKIIVDLELSGVTVIKGGNQLLIAMSGYIGSVLWGSILLFNDRFVITRVLTHYILPVIIFLIGINYIDNGLNIFLSLVSALTIYLLKFIKNTQIKKFILQTIGLISCFYVISDIKDDLITSSLVETDAQIIEYITGIDSLLIGFAVLFFSILIVYTTLRYIIKNKD